MNKIKHLLYALALILAGHVVSYAAVPGTVSASNGVPQRVTPRDGNGNVVPEDHFIGYKVFTATASNAIALTDELGNTVTNGIVHKVCASSSSVAGDWAVLYDTNTSGLATLTAANQSGNNMVYQLTPLIPRSNAVPEQNCLVLDEQFNSGVVVLQQNTGLTNSVVILWRPSKGLGN